MNCYDKRLEDNYAKHYRSEVLARSLGTKITSGHYVYPMGTTARNGFGPMSAVA
jgi:hypothetical protein